MINQNENTKNQFSNAIRKLQIGKLLCKSNITKFHLSADIIACIKSKVSNWMNSQATFIQALFGNIRCES